MKLILSTLLCFLFIYELNSQENTYGEYIYWDKIKSKLENHPNLKIIDFETGLTWMVTVVNKDVINSLHADVEPSSILDKLKSSTLWGGDSWEPRPVLVQMPNGILVAASIHNMPHAGLDDAPFLSKVENRSGGYGTGYNRDYVKNNGMSGHVCLHFAGSRSHKTKSRIKVHQKAIKIASNKKPFIKEGF
jgi:hypothetical protein